jgi:hypothetical protein
LRAVCERRGFALLWPPAGRVPPGSRDAVAETVPPAPRDAPADLGDVALVLDRGPEAFRARGLDVSVPVDDRPFFFHNVAVFGGRPSADAATFLNNTRAVLVLRQLMVIVTLLALLLFFLPFALRRALPREPGFWRGSAFFAAIGLGFMLVEIPVIQRMILYLGHPSHAITVVLASMLLGAGLGSLASARLPGTAIAAWGALLVVAIAAANVGLPHLVTGTIGWAWPARVLAAAGVAGALGLMMGFALPLGMLRFGDVGKPWFWAVNGACGVMASVCSLGLAMTLGFERVMWWGAGLYAVAGLLLVGSRSATLESDPDRSRP